MKVVFKESFFSSVPNEFRVTLSIRCLAGTIAFFFMAAAPMLIPLGIFMIVASSGLFLTTLLSYFILKEKISAFEIITMVLAFGGIVMIGISKMELEDPLLEQIEMFGLSNENKFKLGIVFALIYTMSASCVGVSSRMLKQVNFAVINFNYACFSAISMAIPLLIFYF